jgi:hypothetical protein
VNVVVGAGVTVGLPVPVTVKVYIPGVVPALGVDELLLLPPQAARLPNAANISRTTSIERQLRRRAGTPRKSKKARTAPPPAPGQPLPGSLG